MSFFIYGSLKHGQIFNILSSFSNINMVVSNLTLEIKSYAMLIEKTANYNSSQITASSHKL